jgi:hypothetical protein
LKSIAGRDGAIKILRDKHIDRRLAAINQRLAAQELTESAQVEMLSERQCLSRLKKRPLTPMSDQ